MITPLSLDLSLLKTEINPSNLTLSASSWCVSTKQIMEGSTSSMMLAKESALDFSPLIFTYRSFKFLNEFLIRFEHLIFWVPLSLPFCFGSLSSGEISIPHVESFVSLFLCLDLAHFIFSFPFCSVLLYFVTTSWYTLGFTLLLSEYSKLFSSITFLYCFATIIPWS